MRKQTLPLAGALLAAGLGFGGCTESPTQELRELALRAYAPQKEVEQKVSAERHPAVIRDTRLTTATAIDQALELYPEADAKLRRLLNDMREVEQRMAWGAYRPAEARRLREQHETYWAHLEDHTLPPAYE